MRWASCAGAGPGRGRRADRTGPGRGADADPGFEPWRRGASISRGRLQGDGRGGAAWRGCCGGFGRNPKLKLPFAEAIENNVDLLAIGSLALCFSAAALSGLAGLSPVYGAFLAGIVVGNSTLRSRVIPVIEPIQSILLVVFFLSIGLLIDLDFILANIWLVLAAALLVVALKTALNILLLRITGSDPKTALLAGLSMAQIGEFSFVLAAAGFASGAFGSDIYRLAIAVTAISLLVSPIWFNLMERVEEHGDRGSRLLQAGAGAGL
jgi:CPA2 family monovalent cation:H+ antiporter-2